MVWLKPIGELPGRLRPILRLIRFHCRLHPALDARYGVPATVVGTQLRSGPWETAAGLRPRGDRVDVTPPSPEPGQFHPLTQGTIVHVDRRSSRTIDIMPSPCLEKMLVTAYRHGPNLSNLRLRAV